MSKNFLFVLCTLVVCATTLKAQPFTFSALKPVFLNELEYGEVLFFDLDGDGILDLTGTGNAANTPPFIPRSYIALSGEPYSFADGSEGVVFFERPLTEGLWQSSVAITDFNRDGIADIIMSGRIHNAADFETRPLQGVANLYQGSPSLSYASIPSNLQGVYGGKVRSGDIDGDGDEDLLLSGLTTQDEIAAYIYLNQGGTYQPSNFPYEPLTMGDIELVDIDNDGDHDLALSGVTNTGAFRTRLYHNDGEGNFTERSSNLPGLSFSAMDWGDYDADGDLDLALSGGRYHPTKYIEPVTEIWRNDGGNLNPTGIELASTMDGDLAWGDFDNDGDLDLVVVGRTDLKNGRSGFVYFNEGEQLRPRSSLSGVAASSISIGDYDGDRDLDMVISGSNLSSNPLTRIYRNDSRLINSRPEAPTGLTVREEGGIVILEWQAAVDFETPSLSLSYNLRIGTASGQDNVMVAYSNPITGNRLRSGRGNVGTETFWRLGNLPAGDYFWSVQAIDQAFQASVWSEEGSFGTSGGGKLTATEAQSSPTISLNAGYPNPFQEAITIPFSTRDQSSVEISVYNVLGSRVKQLVNQSLSPGNHQIYWNGMDERGMPVSPGLYLVRMNVGNIHHVQRVTLLR